MVLAGPGSGKTTVTTYRTKRLIEQAGVHPGNILVITFTKAAAKEMEQRFQSIMGEGNFPVTFGTFHAVFFKILKYAYHYSAANILREEEKYQLIRELVEKEDLEIEDIKDFLSSIIGEISAVKGDLTSVENYYSANCSDDVFRRIYYGYDEKLRCMNKVDFDDMLILCYDLLKARKDILALWQKKYKYILIDEFQDINRVQYEIMKMLALPENNLFIVGDDDQSIYRFRGARPEIMLNFHKDYKDCRQIILEENYRSTGEIVAASCRLIKHNQKRFEKKVHSCQEMGAKVSYLGFQDQKLQNQCIIQKIQEHYRRGGQYRDIAVLFRTNLDPRFLVNQLMEHNIPFYMKDVMPNIFEHFIGKDLLTYMEMAAGSKKRSDFLQIMNHPKRYISRDALQHEEIEFARLYTYYRDKQWMLERLEKFEYDLNFIKTMPPYAAITYIRQGIGYDEYLKDYAEFRRMNVEELLEVVQQLEESAKGFSTLGEWKSYIQVYSEELIRQSRESKNREKDAVELVTMHSAKGLEYEIVFLPDAVEGVTPHGKAILEEEIEEERRLFYVAVTRAKKQLYVYHTEQRFHKPVTVSRFVSELQVDFDDIVIGMPVIHKKYGEGVVQDVEEGRITIEFFRNHREMTFSMEYAFMNGIIKLL